MANAAISIVAWGIYALLAGIGRTIFFFATVLLVSTAKAPVGMILFGAIDLIGAVWTGLAMYFDKKQSQLTT